jgi:hypothetical protein
MYLPIFNIHPHNPSRYQPDTIRIKIKNVPLSADDGQIDRALAMEGCEIQGIFRDRLRVDGKLTTIAKARSICPSSADRGTFFIFILIVSG